MADDADVCGKELPLSTDVKAGRGKFLGFMFIARRLCGRVSASCWDDPGFEKSTAKEVAKYIRRGDSVDRVERYENDPQPEWVCGQGCKECLCAKSKGVK